MTDFQKFLAKFQVFPPLIVGTRTFIQAGKPMRANGITSLKANGLSRLSTIA
jgi:hypothetical protein